MNEFFDCKSKKNQNSQLHSRMGGVQLCRNQIEMTSEKNQNPGFPGVEGRDFGSFIGVFLQSKTHQLQSPICTLGRHDVLNR